MTTRNDKGEKYYKGRCYPKPDNCCAEKKPLKICLNAKLPSLQIPPALPLICEWSPEFFFPETVTIDPQMLKLTGLYSIKNGCLQSVSSICSSFDKTPDKSFLDQCKLKVPIPGVIGSVTGGAYFFGINNNYKASLTPYLLRSGKEIVFLPQKVPNDITVNQPNKLIFTARLFYKICKPCCK
jgi:hypothetical protein